MREIRIRYTEDRARMRSALVEAQEKIDKAEARSDAASAQRAKDSFVWGLVSLGLLSIGLAAGLGIGFIAF